MSDYITLLDQVRHCQLCAAQLPLGPRPVLQLHPAARLLIAGQAPGRKVHASGIPFDDASGARLRDWLGLDATQFYDPTLVAILPMGFCYPGTGPHGDLPPRPECAAHWRVPLLQQLPALQLTLVLGQHALAWHLPGAGNITQAVRNWQAGWPDTLPLPHPSPRNNLWLQRNPWFAAEVLPALRQRVQQLLIAS
ncbi:uracil-DNA glycosylase family protein [Aquitalea aquatica]|uniref:Uracil-DNA glycosylase family protein n=1 Tax=Aquitalea aquatica TaxID=3044273 RepID=A0A838Y710_9NEIS|nr:uracil-DNA glycosylase family protein [Aquitalea magnusonii]MBA4708349.1 uracil-DNA glycosylase family protein [Aquitalea magnusonii]